MSIASGRKRLLLGLLGLVIGASAGGFALQSQVSSEGAELLHEAITLIARESPDSLSAAELYEAAAEGLVKQLRDPYSELLSPAELERFSREAMGNYAGVGMLIESVEGASVVMQVYPGSPAAGQGVQSGDRIVRVAGEAVGGLSLDQVSERLRGAPGSRVAVEFLRGEEDRAVEMARQRIQVPTVPFATLVDEGVGYIPIRRFGAITGREVEVAVRELWERGARRFVLDLRGNGGGQLDQAIAVSNLFLAQGERVAGVAFRAQPDEEYRAERPPLSLTVPLVVLIDGASASASEIVAGALQDHDRALVLGTRSFGKGLVQQLFPVEGGWMLKLTTGQWVTPSGRSLQRPRDPRGRPMPQDSAEEAAHPAYQTRAGRSIRGGGGITPDLEIEPEPSDPQAEILAEAIGRRFTEFHGAVSATAYELRGQVGPDFEVDGTMRTRLLSRLRGQGMEIAPAQADSIGVLLDRLLATRVADRLFGEQVAFHRQTSRDPQLRAAVERLREASSTAALLGLGAPQPLAPAGGG